MQDFRPFTGGNVAPTLVGQNPVEQAGVNGSTSPTHRDLLLYIGDLLAGLQTMAANAKIEGVADLLGYAQREVERTRRKT